MLLADFPRALLVPRSALAQENLALRQQLAVLKRSECSRLRARQTVLVELAFAQDWFS